jgi:hypothetical protein
VRGRFEEGYGCSELGVPERKEREREGESKKEGKGKKERED